MSTAVHRDARRAVWMIFGLLAIPVVSVSLVAVLADIASTTDPTAALIGVPATLAGVAVGIAVLRLAAVAHSGAVALRATLLEVIDDFAAAIETTVGLRRPTAAFVPAVVLLPAPTGRRGPPAVHRF